MRIYHAVEWHSSDEPRIHRVWQNWDAHYKANRMIPARLDAYPFDSTMIGDKRKMPLVTDVLDKARQMASKDDLILLTNGDTLIHRQLFPLLKQRMEKQGAVCSFRLNVTWKEDLLDQKPEALSIAYQPDYGRDLFCFTKAWLDQHWSKVPPMFVGEWEWDLIVVLLIRTLLGIGVRSTKELLRVTGAEIPTGYVLHERHFPKWITTKVDASPAKAWNRSVSRGWYEDMGMSHLYTLGK